MKKLLPLLILMSLVSAQESSESHIDNIETSDAVVELTDISGNKVRGTIIETYGTYIVLSVEGKGRTLIPRSSIKSIQSFEGSEVAGRERSKMVEQEESVLPKSDYNPCEDERYLSIKEKELDMMSEREYEYFLLKEKECSESKKLVGGIQNQDSETISNFSIISDAKADAKDDFNSRSTFYFLGTFTSSILFSPLVGGTSSFLLATIFANISSVEAPSLKIQELELKGYTDVQINSYVSTYRSEGQKIKNTNAFGQSCMGIFSAWGLLLLMFSNE